MCQELRSDGKGEDVAGMEEGCPDLPLRQGLPSSCGLRGPQLPALQGGPPCQGYGPLAQWLSLNL